VTTPEALVLSIGEELLDGRVLDTNASWIAQRLRLIGVRTVAMRTIGDTPGALHALLSEVDGSVPLVVSSGGLGPTADDRVRLESAAAAAACAAPGSDGVARECSARELLVDIEHAVPELADLWRRQHQSEAPNFFLDQGRMPQQGIAIGNATGTAWGFAVDLPKGTRLVCLAGPPRECKSCWDGGGRAAAQQQIGAPGELAYGLFHIASMPESAVEARVRDLLEAGGNPRMGITAQGKLVTLSVLAHPESGRSAAEVFAQTEAELRQRMGEWLWGTDGQSQAEVVVAALRERGQRVATAESCTGGGLAAALTAVPGASSVLEYGWVCYANAAKSKELGVPAEWMDGRPGAPGAVSAEVAQALAEGARRESGAEWGVGITGIAGPDGGSVGKPVGTVWIGIAGPTGSHVVLRQQWTRAGRAGVQLGSVRDALEVLRRRLLELPDLPERQA